MKKYLQVPYPTLLAAASILLLSCGGSDGGEDPDPDPVVPAPAAATLIFPEDNSECTEGEVLNETQSRVTFQWNASQNTDSYQISLRNLNTNSTSLATSSTTEADITLQRGVPYEWFVSSRANGTTETASSPVWKFYNAGPGISSYAPFPAEAIFPVRGSELAEAGTISLQWDGSDVDEDIVEYEIYIDAGEEEPVTLLARTAETTAAFVTVAGTTYAWKVVTIDASGNSTASELFQFKTAQ